MYKVAKENKFMHNLFPIWYMFGYIKNQFKDLELVEFVLTKRDDVITCKGSQKAFSKADTAVPLKLYEDGVLQLDSIDALMIAKSELEGLLTKSFGF
jgi:hypothetical protein